MGRMGLLIFLSFYIALFCVYMCMCVSWCTKRQSEDSVFELLSFYYGGPRDQTLDASKYLHLLSRLSGPGQVFNCWELLKVWDVLLPTSVSFKYNLHLGSRKNSLSHAAILTGRVWGQEAGEKEEGPSIVQRLPGPAVQFRTSTVKWEHASTLLIYTASMTGFTLGQNLSKKGPLDSKQLTARRLWLISAPSIFVCLSESLASAALSLPAKSMKEILKNTQQQRLFGALVYFHISWHFVTSGGMEHSPSSEETRHHC